MHYFPICQQNYAILRSLKNKKYVILRSFTLTDYAILRSLIFKKYAVLRSFDLKKALYKYFSIRSFVRNPTQWDFIRRRRISSCVARFHLPTGKSHCAYSRARGGRSGKGVAGVSDKPCRRKWLRTGHLYYVTPKLVCRKSASRRTTVSKLYRWRQVCRSQPARRVKKITNRV